MLVALLLLALAGAEATRSTRLTEVYAWKTVDFVFPNPEQREEQLTNGQFLLHRTMPLGLEVWRDKLFITIPRRRAGVPAVLGYISLNNTERSPLVTPYPDWFTNNLPLPGEPEDTTHITIAYRIRADACNRLWVVDTGLADVGKGFKPYSKPKLLIYNLLNDKLFHKYMLKDDDFSDGSYFANIAVDVTAETCDEAYAYMADLGANGLVVYSLKDNDSWRVKHSYFFFDPLAANFDIDGFDFQLNDGAFSSALSAIKEDGYRTFYFHSLSSYNEFAVSTRILRNKTLANKNHHDYKNLGYRGDNSQASATFFDEKTGVLFFGEIQNHAITCWNTIQKPTMTGNIGIIAADPFSRAFIYPCDVKVDTEDNLWVLNNNIPRYIFGDLDPNEYNYFIFKAPVREAIRDTICDVKPTCETASSYPYVEETVDSRINVTDTKPPPPPPFMHFYKPHHTPPGHQWYSPYGSRDTLDHE